MNANTNFNNTYDEKFRLVTQGKDLKNYTPSELNWLVGNFVLEMSAENWKKTTQTYEKGKQASYISMEWLLGRAILNNLISLRLYDSIVPTLIEKGVDPNKFDDIPEQNLGNGGLGRLAACFIDAAATDNLPMRGYGLRHYDGFFKQAFENGMQIELPDTWLENGEEPWSIRREEEKIFVKFADIEAWAVPYDIPIFGYNTDNINTLRVWQAEPHGDITKNLYPDDSCHQGKILRVRQEYLLVYASIMDMIRICKRNNYNLKDFDKYFAVQLNDTHPVMAIPVLYKYLTEEEKISQDEALNIVKKTFGYTNHTVLAEALEKIDGSILRSILPDLFNVIDVLNRRFIDKLAQEGKSWSVISNFQFILNDSVQMANIAIENSHMVNGVAKIHTDILKFNVLNHWYNRYPELFTNHTNGVTQRRWLLLSNPKLAAFLTKLLKSDQWITDFNQVESLKELASNPEVIDEFISIKQSAKEKCADYIYKHEGVRINPNALYDVQVKRIHLYKRQLLNILSVYDYYQDIKYNRIDRSILRPVVSIIGGKAAPGYRLAKVLIAIAKQLQDLINNDPEVNQYLQFVFVTNFNTSYGEVLYPAADISEQISTAGKEASGTGNMKFMMNGALTLGTYDGANIEIFEEAGINNNFLFGAYYDELKTAHQNGYNSTRIYNDPKNYNLKCAIDWLKSYNHLGGNELYNSLLYPMNGSPADEFFVLKDFESYVRMKKIAYKEYFEIPKEFARKQLINIFSSSKFSANRTIQEYATEWEIKPAKINS